MIFLIQNIDELKKLFHYVNDDNIAYSDKLLAIFYNNCFFLQYYEKQITCQTKITSEDILYSLYYWGASVSGTSE